MPHLRLVDLACARGGRVVFAGVELVLAAGQAALLTGPNGSGKTSLLRLAAGLGTPLAGAVEREGRLAHLGHLDAVKPQQSVREALRFWADFAGADRGGVEAALNAFDLAPLADLPGRVLSAGQRRRLALARPLVTAAEIWLLDEPTLGLDAASVDRLAAAMVRHRRAGGIVMLATHVPVDLPGATALRMDDHAPPLDLDDADDVPFAA